jgi:hypothetical protein
MQRRKEIEMRHCPHCQQPTIPLWHAHLGKFFSKPLTCPNCHSVLVREFSLIREVSLMVPLVVIMIALRYWDVKPLEFVLFIYGFAGLAGLCLWSHTVKYKVKTE